MGLPAVGWKVQVCLPCVPTLVSSHCCHISSLCGREWAAGHPAVLVLLPLFSAWGYSSVSLLCSLPHASPTRRCLVEELMGAVVLCRVPAPHTAHTPQVRSAAVQPNVP